MSLEVKLMNMLNSQKDFVIATGVYLTASASDYMSTTASIINHNAIELNPIMNKWIEYFGVNDS